MAGEFIMPYIKIRQNKQSAAKQIPPLIPYQTTPPVNVDNWLGFESLTERRDA